MPKTTHKNTTRWIAICTVLTICTSVASLSVYAEKSMTIRGQGQGILPDDVPTLFSFSALRDEKGNVSGHFECFAVIPDGGTMYVKGNVTSLTVADNQSSIALAGPAVVTGFGSGTGRFNAIATPEGTGMSNLVLTTDVNGDGVQGSMSDGSEGPFKEKVVKSSLQIK